MYYFSYLKGAKAQKLTFKQYANKLTKIKKRLKRLELVSRPFIFRVAYLRLDLTRLSNLQVLLN